MRVARCPAMPYRFKHDDASVQEGLRRIALDQIDKAIEDSHGDDRAEAVHAVRKRCKKLRGLVRLVRPVFDGYGDENTAFRDAARALSGVRDAQVMQETYDKLLDRFDGEVERAPFGIVRRRLTLQRREMAGTRDLDAELTEFRAKMRTARKRADDWSLDGKGFPALAGGLGKTYGRAGQAMRRARKKPTGETMHEWRKRAKYHWYHARLLTPIWPQPMAAHADAADTLSDLLGDHHDLVVFRETLADGDFGDAAAALSGLAVRQEAELAAAAFTLGARLFAEPSDALAARWARYWRAWRKCTPSADAVAPARVAVDRQRNAAGAPR